MPQVTIENPVVGFPFGEPSRHFRFTNEGIANEVVEARRVGLCVTPVARPKKRGNRLSSSGGAS